MSVDEVEAELEKELERLNEKMRVKLGKEQKKLPKMLLIAFFIAVLICIFVYAFCHSLSVGYVGLIFIIVFGGVFVGVLYCWSWIEINPEIKHMLCLILNINTTDSYDAIDHKRAEIRQKLAEIQQKWKMEERAKKLKTRQGLYSLSPREFESGVAEILRANGYEKVEVTPFVGDVGTDIIAYKGGRKYVVQCKQYAEETKVGTPELQKLQGSMLGYRADAMIFVTLGFFSKKAVEYAHENGIQLVDGDELIDMAQALGKEGVS